MKINMLSFCLGLLVLVMFGAMLRWQYNIAANREAYTTMRPRTPAELRAIEQLVGVRSMRRTKGIFLFFLAAFIANDLQAVVLGEAGLKWRGLLFIGFILLFLSINRIAKRTVVKHRHRSGTHLFKGVIIAYVCVSFMYAVLVSHDWLRAGLFAAVSAVFAAIGFAVLLRFNIERSMPKKDKELKARHS